MGMLLMSMMEENTITMCEQINIILCNVNLGFPPDLHVIRIYPDERNRERLIRSRF